MKTGVIYKITSPTGKIYIGKAVNFTARYNTYRNYLAKGQPALHNSFLGHGFDAHLFEILETASIEKLEELEINYIEKYKSFVKDNKDGLNLTRGGGGCLGRKDSKETKEKRALSNTGNKRSEETRKRMSLAAKGKPKNFTPEELEKRKKRFIGNTINLGRKQSPELAAKRIATMESKGIIFQLNNMGEIIKEWPYNYTLIAKNIGCDKTTIRKSVLSNGTKELKGYYWKGVKNA